LRAERAASQQTVDDALSQLATTRADLKVARESLALALAGPRREEIEQAAAELEAAAAEVRLRQEILADTELRAPKNGVIRNRILEPGDMATPQSPVFTLAFDDPVWVRAYVPETLLGRIRPGMQASIESDSFPGKRYPGWVGYLSPTAEFTPKNVETPELRTRLVYQARIYACNPEGELRLGMPVTVQIELRQAAPTNTAPTETVPDCATASE
jgi:HlyD family secretion protein